jgi:predicted RNase H-like HicB family nuclease
MFREVIAIPSYYDSLWRIESIGAGQARKESQRVPNHMRHEVMLTRDEDGRVVAECQELPGCVSQGKNEAEALSNIREAIAGWRWAEEQKSADARS